MSKHHFIICDCCPKEQEILEDDNPHYTRHEFENEHWEQRNGKNALVLRGLPRRDLCANCYRRIKQALIQVPDSLWLLEGFEVQK
jgi:hypothetical protein